MGAKYKRRLSMTQLADLVLQGVGSKGTYMVTGPKTGRSKEGHAIRVQLKCKY
jgi:hypothetical protein